MAAAAVIACTASITGQLPPSTAPRFDSARAWTHLEAQVAFGPRPAGSAALQKTRDYILAELKKGGIEARPIDSIASRIAAALA